MPTEAPIKLVDASEPKIVLELPDGATRNLDPWEVAEKIEAGIRQAVKEEAATLARTFDVIRQAVGLPTQAEVDAANDPKPITLSRNACMKLQGAVNRFVEGFEQQKK